MIELCCGWSKGGRGRVVYIGQTICGERYVLVYLLVDGIFMIFGRGFWWGHAWCLREKRIFWVLCGCGSLGFMVGFECRHGFNSSGCNTPLDFVGIVKIHKFSICLILLNSGRPKTQNDFVFCNYSIQFVSNKMTSTYDWFSTQLATINS